MWPTIARLEERRELVQTVERVLQRPGAALHSKFTASFVSPWAL